MEVAVLQLTELGLGAAQLGNLYHAISDDDAAGVVDEAWAGGIRYFDTSPHYGMGLSERRLGRLLSRYPRDEYVLSTKVGRLIVPNPSGLPDGAEIFDVPATTQRVWDFSRDGILRSVQASLERLGLDRIDILYLHDIDVYLRTPGARWRDIADAAVPALAELRDEGVIAAFGAGINDAGLHARLIRESDVDVLLVAGRFTLLEQGALEELLPLALERSVAIVAAAVFNSGLLATNRPASNATYEYEAAPPELVARANRLADVCESFDVDLPAAALQYPLQHPAVRSVVAGAHSADQVRQNIHRFRAPIPDELWTALRSAGLIENPAPPKEKQ
jgi:D-threo-aldose 1-dehydrogenase